MNRLAFLLFAASCAASATVHAETPFFDITRDLLEVSPDAVKSKQAKVELAGNAQQITFDLGKQRTGWGHGRWAVRTFAAPRNLAGANALELAITTQNPRADVGVHLALRETGGTWYVHPLAVDLTQTSNRRKALFDDFRTAAFWGPPGGGSTDPNGKLDLDQIDAIAIGCVDPTGIGVVNFAVTAITPVGTPPTPPQPVQVDVTGKLLNINNTANVPVGIFGSFAMGRNDWDNFRLGARRSIISQQGLGGAAQFGTPTTPIHLNCVGERIHPSPRLTHADWERRLQESAQAHARAAKEKNETLWVEFWNEPYLNWANRNRVNFNPAFFEEADAAEGAPVKLKIDGQVMPHLRWTQNFEAPLWRWSSLQDWRRGRDATGKVWSKYAMPYFYPRRQEGYHPETHPPVDIKDGQRYTVEIQKLERDEQSGRTRPVPTGEKVELTAFTPWHVYDETQYEYWSGKGMLKFYLEPATAYGKALKHELPTAKFFVGWGMRPSENRWGAWEMLYQPIIDACIDFIDGYHDHDYGDDPLRMNAVYETLTTYGMVKHNKWLYGINTEQGPALDSQAYPELQRDTLRREARAEWVARKIMHALATIPDKALIHCHFAWDREGDGYTFKLLRNLRGKLVAVDASDPFIYAVAAIDGTDPLAPRPADMTARKELVVALLNDHIAPRDVDLAINAPTGTTFDGAVIRRIGQGAEGKMALLEEPAQATGKTHRLKLTIPARRALTVSLPLQGNESPAAEIHRKQFFAPAILHQVGKAPLDTPFNIDVAELKSAKRSWLRIVVERLADGEGIVFINGHRYALPKAITSENGPWLRQVTVDPAHLKDRNLLSFQTTGPDQAGYLLCSASLLLER